jgi:hypothetical protein
MEDIVEANRLAGSGSPYLEQHAENPVHWQPWDRPARETAAAADVPIFLSVGYAACHWCHVMADESFEDPAVAEVLNTGFVPVKVDREERPDIDRVYQTICQLVTGGGGWPLSVWLTPDLEPFYVGTYFPRDPDPRRRIPGFVEVCTSIRASWEDDRAAIEERASEWTAAIEQHSGPVSGGQPHTEEPPDALETDRVLRTLLRTVDTEHGGFGTDGPKFPQPRRLRYLMAQRQWGGGTQVDAAIRTTLDAMAAGGLYDQLAGGFHRYTVDRSWTVPHFEKMLYDNAELLAVYSLAAHAYDDDGYARVARGTADALLETFAAPEGGFYSSIDAQSEGAEGSYYVWTPASLEAAVDDPTDAAIAAEFFGVTEAGNFEGKTVLTRRARARDVAASVGVDPSEVTPAVARAREAMLAARARRPAPATDTKVIAAWNGLAIDALVLMGGLLEAPAYIDAATDALERVRRDLVDGGVVARRVRDGAVQPDGFVDDHAFVGMAALRLHAATGRSRYLQMAVEIAGRLADAFYDTSAGTFTLRSAEAEQVVTATEEVVDRSIPAASAVAADLLYRLDPVLVDIDGEAIAQTVLARHRNQLTAQPTQHVTLHLLGEVIDRPSRELVTSGAAAQDSWSQVADLSTRGLRVLHRPADDPATETIAAALGFEAIPPIWRGRSTDAEPRLFACSEMVCAQPTADSTQARADLRFSQS